MLHHHSAANLKVYLLLLFWYFVYMCVYLPCVGLVPLGALGLELQMVVSCLWVLGIDPKFSGRAGSVLNC